MTNARNIARAARAYTYLNCTVNVSGIDFLVRVYSVSVDEFGEFIADWSLCLDAIDEQGNNIIAEMPPYFTQFPSMTRDEFTCIRNRVIENYKWKVQRAKEELLEEQE